MSRLIAQCALGDQTAFADLYRQTSAKLLGVSQRILKGGWAEQVLQDSFINIWTLAAEYSARKSALMTMMIRNLAMCPRLR